MHASRQSPRILNRPKRKKEDEVTFISNSSAFQSSTPSKIVNRSFRASQNIRSYTSKFESQDSNPQKYMSKYTNYIELQKEIATYFPKVPLNAFIDSTNWQLVKNS